MRSIVPSITRRGVFIIILLLLIITTYLSEDMYLHFLPFIILFSGGSSNKKVFLFFFFLLAPSITQYIFKGSRDGRHFLRYTCLFLFFISFLYIIGAYMFYSLTREYCVSTCNNFIVFEQGGFEGIMGNFNNNQILKPVINILTDSMHMPSLLPGGYRWIDYFFPSWIFYLSSIVLLISFYLWVRMGIELIEKPRELLLASIPAYGLFVTSIDGGAFTPFALSSMGAFLSFMIYRLYDDKSFKKIFLVITAAISPAIPIYYLLLFFSTTDYLFPSSILISLMYSFFIVTILLARYEFRSEAISEKIISYYRRLLRLLSINLSEKKSRDYMHKYTLYTFGAVSLCLFIICIYMGYSTCGLLPESRESNFMVEVYKQEFLNMSEEEISEFFIKKDMDFLIRYRDGPHVYGEFFFDEPVSFNELREKFIAEDLAVYPRNLEINKTITALIIPNDHISGEEFDYISQVDGVSNTNRREKGIFLEVRANRYDAMNEIYEILKDKQYFLVIFL